MTVNDTTTTPKGAPAQVRSGTIDKVMYGERPPARKKPRGGFSQLVHTSPETYNPPSRAEVART